MALNALKEIGVFSEVEANSVNPRHIVDGHREKTLSLLWMIILHFQVIMHYMSYNRALVCNHDTLTAHYMSSYRALVCNDT